MQDDQIQNTFKIIRNLPLEIDFSKIEQFVLSQPLTIFSNINYSWLNYKNIIIMVSSASLLSILVMLNTGNNVQPVQTVKEEKKEIVKNEIVQNAEKEPGQKPPSISATFPAEIKKEAGKVKEPVTEIMPAAIIDKKTIDSTTGELQAVLPPVFYAAPIPEIPETEAPAGCNPVPVPCNCKCNDGNNVTCTFQEKLLDDELIGETEKFSFSIDSKSFIVNGKEQPENVYKKYSRVYKELTGKKLTEGSYMRVEVEKGHCSININHND